MKELNFETALQQILRRERRYDPEAYRFVREALDYAVALLKSEAGEGKIRHVSGRELLEGLRRYVVKEYGPLGRRVLAHWGIRRTEDIGDIVFLLVEQGVLGKTEQDSRRDFAGVYDFEEVFDGPFAPARRRATARREQCRTE